MQHKFVWKHGSREKPVVNKNVLQNYDYDYPTTSSSSK